MVRLKGAGQIGGWGSASAYWDVEDTAPALDNKFYFEFSFMKSIVLLRASIVVNSL